MILESSCLTSWLQSMSSRKKGTKRDDKFHFPKRSRNQCRKIDLLVRKRKRVKQRIFFWSYLSYRLRPWWRWMMSFRWFLLLWERISSIYSDRTGHRILSLTAWTHHGKINVTEILRSHISQARIQSRYPSDSKEVYLSFSEWDLFLGRLFSILQPEIPSEELGGFIFHVQREILDFPHSIIMWYEDALFLLGKGKEFLDVLFWESCLTNWAQGENPSIKVNRFPRIKSIPQSISKGVPR